MNDKATQEREAFEKWAEAYIDERGHHHDFTYDEWRSTWFAWQARAAPLQEPAGCGFPYCGGNAPECKTCGNKRAAAPSQAAPAIAERIAELEKRDSEAANHVEAVICLRTKFTGRPPYMGWKGLGLALTEALDERDALREALAAPLDAPSLTEQQKIAICKALLGYSNRKSINAIDAAMALSSKEPGNLSEAKGADGLPANAKRLWGDEPIDDQSW